MWLRSGAQYPSDVSHNYDDKFTLAEVSTRASLKAVGTCLDAMAPGWRANLGQLRQWASTRTVTLRFELSEACAFDRTEHREVASDTKVVSEKTGVL